MKKIMILGAGIYQVPLIKTAKKLGLYTIVVSIPGNYPGFELADKVYYENTVDDEKILEIAKEEQITGENIDWTDLEDKDEQEQKDDPSEDKENPEETEKKKQDPGISERDN